MPSSVPTSVSDREEVQGQGSEGGQHLRGAGQPSTTAVCEPAGLQDGLHSEHPPEDPLITSN